VGQVADDHLRSIASLRPVTTVFAVTMLWRRSKLTWWVPTTRSMTKRSMLTVTPDPYLSTRWEVADCHSRRALVWPVSDRFFRSPSSRPLSTQTLIRPTCRLDLFGQWSISGTDSSNRRSTSRFAGLLPTAIRERQRMWLMMVMITACCLAPLDQDQALHINEK